TVMRIVIDAQWCPILQDHAPGAFYLHRKQIGWILQPAEFKFLPVKRACLDRAAVVVWYDLALSVEATNARPLVGKRIGPRLLTSYDQVMRAAVDWDVEFRTGKARASHDRLEITG